MSFAEAKAASEKRGIVTLLPTLIAAAHAAAIHPYYIYGNAYLGSGGGNVKYPPEEQFGNPLLFKYPWEINAEKSDDYSGVFVPDWYEAGIWLAWRRLREDVSARELAWANGIYDEPGDAVSYFFELRLHLHSHEKHPEFEYTTMSFPHSGHHRENSPDNLAYLLHRLHCIDAVTGANIWDLNQDRVHTGHYVITARNTTLYLRRRKKDTESCPPPANTSNDSATSSSASSGPSLNMS